MPSRWPTTRRRFLALIVIIFGIPFLLAAILLLCFWRYSPVNREWVVETLEKRYQCEVELKSFTASFFPVMTIAGEGLVLEHQERPGLPPLAIIRKFSATGNWLGLLRHPRHFGQVRLEGMVIAVPPRSRQAQAGKEKRQQQVSPFVLDEVFADDAVLKILSSNANKPPHVFEIRKLRMQSAGLGQPMSFQVTLTNPIPVGQIRSKGRFGPWDSVDPSLTPVSGNYSFSDADLSTIRGLGGILSSHGNYEGVLNEIQVRGETDTPNFDLGISGNKIHLKTQFSAVVDGVSGDTLLQPVDAQLLGSKIVARGRVAQVAGGNGRSILLDVTAQPARLEDLLRLAVKSSAPSMTGGLSIHTKFDLHPGEEAVAKRLRLDGSFNVQSAQFTDPETEAKITSFSRRGQGKPNDEDIQDTRFGLQGHFVLADSQATFSSLSFSLPGASLQLQGAFGLISQALDFHGTLRLQAKVSETTTGIKSLLLKAVDPLFEREGAGTVLPIKITGTREEPVFQVEIGKVLKRED
ncbi:MAG TPA: hypothetical protein VEO19_11150 [Terriglobia bacterium]|nr:hypothetical protein [Terriglobia bacterium]